MKIKSHIFFLVIFLQSNDIKIFSMEVAYERNSSIDVSKNIRESTTQHTTEEAQQHAIAEQANHPSQPQATGVIHDAGSGTDLPQATPINGTLVEGSHNFRIDPTQPVEAIQPEPIQAIRIDEAFDPKKLEFVDGATQEQPSSLFRSSTKFSDYNARRTGQADPMKSGKALIDMRNAMNNVDAYNMNGADVLKFSDYQDQLSLIETQWVKDPTQIKSADLATFLNDFKDFAGKQMNHYNEGNLDRSSWQKVIDAIQDFFDLAFGYDKQAIVVAQPIHEELLPQQNKNDAPQSSLFT